MKRKTSSIAAALLTSIILIISSLAMTGCAGRSSTDNVVMTYVSSPLNVPSVIEKDEGIYRTAFKNIGIKLEYSNLTSGADQTAALESGDVHILNAVGCSSVITAAANGSDIVILSMYSRAPEAYGIFSNDSSIDTAKDLKGKTVAGPKGSNLHELLAAYLSDAKMDMNDVNYVDMDIPSAAAALDGGSIDAALLGGPAAYSAEKNGKHKITGGKGLISAGICTAASRKFAEENPDIVKTFLDTQNKIVEEMNSSKEKSFKTTAKELDLEPNAVKNMFSMYDYRTEISAKDICLLRNTEDFLYDSGMIENKPDIKELIYSN